MNDYTFSEDIHTDTEQDQKAFESAMHALRAEIANIGTHAAIDGTARAAYDQQVSTMARELRTNAKAGQITWRQAATEANLVRNTVMETIRGRSTPVGRALAEAIKSQGVTLNEIVAKKTIELFGRTADFNRLTPA